MVMHKVLTEPPTPPSELAEAPAALEKIPLTALGKDRENRDEDRILLRNGPCLVSRIVPPRVGEQPGFGGCWIGVAKRICER